MTFFNEFVEGEKNMGLRRDLAVHGFDHVLASRNVQYSPGRAHNQILVASKLPISNTIEYSDGQDGSANTNILTVEVGGLAITGIRAPAYVTLQEWRTYWDWLGTISLGDVLIGDLNIDPQRNSSRDRVHTTLTESLGWAFVPVDGDWSYKGVKGNTARLDHCLVRDGAIVANAKYIPSPFVPAYTDHAAIVVDVAG